MSEVPDSEVRKPTKKQIGRGLDLGQSACVINVLLALIEDKTAIIYLPKSDYQPMGAKHGRDPRVVEEPLARSLEVIGLLCGGSGRRTVCFRTLKEVKVLPADGESGRPLPMNVWRVYAPIVDGALNEKLDRLEVSSLQRATFDRLVFTGAIEDEPYDPAKTYSISMKDRPIASAAWAHPHTLGFVDLLRREQDLLHQKRLLLKRRRNGNRRLTKKIKQGRLSLNPTATDGLALAARLPIYKETKLVDSRADGDRPSAQLIQVTTIIYKLIGYTPEPYTAADIPIAGVDKALRDVNRELERVRCRARLMVIAMEEHKGTAIPWGAPIDSPRGRKYGGKFQCAQFDDVQLRRITKRITCERNAT